MKIKIDKLIRVPGVDDQNKILTLTSAQTSADKLVDLVTDESPIVRYLAAYHPNANDSVAEKVQADGLAWVTEASAYNPSTSHGVLLELLAKNSPEINAALAANPSLDEQSQLELVGRLSNDLHFLTLANTTNSFKVWRAIGDIYKDKKVTNRYGESSKHWGAELHRVSSVKITAKSVAALLRRVDYRYLWVSRLLCQMDDIPQEILGHLMHYCPEDLASNSQIALTLLEDPAAIPTETYKEWKLKQWLAERLAPAMVTNYFLSNGDIKRQRQATRGIYSTPYKNQWLALHADNQIRKFLAERPDLTSFMTVILANDSNKSVYEAYKNNKKISKAHVIELSTKKKSNARKKNVDKVSPTERSKQARRTESESQQLEYAKDSLAKVRLSLVGNRNLHDSVIEELCQDRSKAVRAEVADRYGELDTVFDLLRNDESFDVKATLLDGARRWSRRRVPVSKLLTMTADKDSEVRLAIIKKYKTLISDNDRQRKKQDEATLGLKEERSLEDALTLDPDPRVRVALAEFLKFEENQLKLSQDSDLEVRVRLASNGFLSEAVLLKLCDDESSKVVQAITNRRTKPQAILEKLGESLDEGTLIRLLKRGEKNFPDATIASILGSDNKTLRKIFAETLGWKPIGFEALANDPSEFVRIGLAGSRNLSFEQISTLYQDQSAKVREACIHSFSTLKTTVKRADKNASNKSGSNTGSLDVKDIFNSLFSSHHTMPTEQVIELSDDDNRQLECLMANDSDNTVKASLATMCTSVECQTLLLEDQDPAIRESLTKNGWLNDDILNILTEDDDERIRIRLARRTSLSAELLNKFLVDPSHKVRKCLIRNKKLTPSHRKALASDSNKEIRLEMAYEYGHLPECFEVLHQDKDEEVRSQLARHYELKFEQTLQLANDQSESVRLIIVNELAEYLGQRSSYDEDMSDEEKLKLSLVFASDPSPVIRAQVAKHIPQLEVQQILSTDSDENVREALSNTARLNKKIALLMCEDTSDLIRQNIAKRVGNNREILTLLTQDPNPKIRYAAYERNTGKKGYTARNGLRDKGKEELLARMSEDLDTRIQRLYKGVLSEID